MIEIASYRKRKRRNCFKKTYYKTTWVLSNDFARFKRGKDKERVR